MSANMILRRNPEIVHSDIDGEIVMMSVRNGLYYGANRVGSTIWNLLEHEVSIDDLCTELLRRFEIDEAACRKEVTMFVDQLVEQGLLEWISAEGEIPRL